MERFLGTHDGQSLLRELRKKGLGPVAKSSWRDMAGHAAYDMLGLKYNLESFASFMSSDLLDPPDEG